MNPKTSKQIIIISLAILLAIGIMTCHNTNKQWQVSAAQFESMVKDTLSIYDKNIDHYIADKAHVIIYVRKDRWNSSSKQTKQEFLKEVCTLIDNDAQTSGITKHTSVLLSFYTSDKDLIQQYTIKGSD